MLVNLSMCQERFQTFRYFNKRHVSDHATLSNFVYDGTPEIIPCYKDCL